MPRPPARLRTRHCVLPFPECARNPESTDEICRGNGTRGHRHASVLREAAEIAQQLEATLAQACPHFASREAWDAYVDGSVDRVVTLVAHLEQAWVEAKQTGDKDVRREAKAPRRRVDRAQQLLAKLQACGNGNGASVEPGAVWRRVERAVPRRQSEIALPQ